MTPSSRTRSAPFFLVVALVLSASFVWALWVHPELRDAGRITLVVVLAAVHLAGHWRWLTTPPGRWSWLLVLQAGLVAALGLLLRTPEVTLTLALILVGECVATLPRRQAILAGAVLLALPVAHTLLDGSPEVRQFLWVIAPTALFVVVWVEGFQRQARERARAEAALQELDAAHAKLAAYAGKVEALTLQGERQRMARELHDTLSQGLAGLVLQLEAADAHLQRGDSARVETILRQSRGRARATLAEARAAIDDLREVTGTAQTVEDVVAREADRFSASTGIPVERSIETSGPASAPRLTQVQRFVSESLMNVTRHARASRVRVAAEREGAGLRVVVADDGVGFEPASVEGLPGHYGLLGLRERARLAGGSVEVQSASGRGTQVTLRLPAEEEAR